MFSNQILMIFYNHMKIMTINLHSYIEENSEQKLEIFIDAVSRIRPDIIAMQEINQKATAPAIIKDDIISAQFGIELKADNYAYRIANALSEKKCDYKLVWVGIKRAYEIYDEGICFLSQIPIDKATAFLISKCDDIRSWRKRMALGIKVNGEWFYNLHMGRWDDETEPFYNQWKNFEKNIKKDNPVWIMGDFNSPSDIQNEGYDCVLSSQWYDTYTLAQKKDSGHTISGKIDGWNDKDAEFKNKRIDYIFTNKKREIKSSYTVFNGKNEQIISDHYAILLSY